MTISKINLYPKKTYEKYEKRQFGMVNNYFKRNWDLLGLWILSPALFLIVNIIFRRIIGVNLNSFYGDTYTFLILILIFFLIGLFRNAFVSNLRKNWLRWIFLIIPIILLLLIWYSSLWHAFT
ncbi:MAG: hypothetical protein PHF67_04325 [Candidatus Nanoarchaeia archaeon]|nr:hypothetical protein [Candidatus Nanoarchaeia archaeon]